MHHCDVLIIGGGPAGAVASRELARAGLRTLLVDDTPPGRPKIGESLLAAALPILRHLGLEDWAGRSRPLANVGNVSSWGEDELVATDFIRDPHGAGWHLDRALFDQCLREAAIEAGTHFCVSRVSAISATPSAWQVRLADQVVTATWLIDASGRARILTRKLGIPKGKDEPLISLHAWGRNFTEDGRSLVESVPEGWWYTAALPNGLRVAALQVTPAHAAWLLRQPAGWHQSLKRTRHVSQWCKLDETWCAPQSADATATWASQTYGQNWLAVGDAALCFDPLSSQGLFNALYTGLRGAQALLQSRGQDEKPLAAYGSRLAEIRQAYRRQVLFYYGQERRWQRFPFWQIRHLAQSEALRHESTLSPAG